MYEFNIFYFMLSVKNTNLLATDGLFGGLQQFIDNLFRLKCDEAETFPLILGLVKRHLNFYDLKR